jgi:hypothetical protein
MTMHLLTSFLVREFLAKHETAVVPQSLQIWPLGTFFLFPKLKSTLKGCRFQTIEEIEENSLQDLHALPQNAFQNWKKKTLEAVIDSGGEYFERDKSY